MEFEKNIFPGTIALIDRFPTIRTGLRLLLTNRLGDIRVIEGSDVATFCQSYKGGHPDLILVGLSQTEHDNNFNVLSQLQRSYPRAKLIVHDFMPTASMIPQYFHAGIAGYLTISTNECELGECITSVLKGKKYIDSDGLILLLDAVPTQIPELYPAKILTSRESQIANYLIRGAKTSEIAEILGRQYSTISTIKKSIYKKLHVSNLIELNSAIIGR